MLSKFSGSRRDLQFVLLLGVLLAVLGISLFLTVSMGSVAIDLSLIHILPSILFIIGGVLGFLSATEWIGGFLIIKGAVSFSKFLKEVRGLV